MKVQISYYVSDEDHGSCDRYGSIQTDGFPCDPTPYLEEVNSVKELLDIFAYLNIEPVIENGAVYWREEESLTSTSLECTLYGVTKATSMRIARYMQRFGWGDRMDEQSVLDFTLWHQDWKGKNFSKHHRLCGLHQLVAMAQCKGITLDVASGVIYEFFSRELTIWQLFYRKI